MELTYELTTDDHVAFNLYHAEHSQTVKRSLFIQRFLVPIIFPVIPFVLFWITGDFLIGLLIIYVLLSLVWIALYPKYFYRLIKKNVEKLLNEGNNDNLLGPHVFITYENGFIEKNSAEESKVSWSSIEKVAENEAYYFLMFSTMSAYIVPKRSFENKDSHDEFKRIVSELTRR